MESIYRKHICEPEILSIRAPPIVPPSSQSCLRGDDRRHSVKSIVLEGEATSTCSTKAGRSSREAFCPRTKENRQGVAKQNGEYIRRGNTTSNRSAVTLDSFSKKLLKSAKQEFKEHLGIL